MGGYNRNDGFLNTVERFDANTETWTTVATMQMPEKKSHFCLVMASPVKTELHYQVTAENRL